MNYTVTELCVFGELFYMIKDTGAFDEAVARHYSKELLEALAYLHSKGIAHWDIKADNIFIHKSLELKFGDFGHATTEEESFEEKGTIG